MAAAVHDLLEALSAAGVIIEAHGNGLRYRPASALTPDLLSAVKSCKQDLLKILPDRSLLLDDLGGSGLRSPSAASVAQVHHTTNLNKVDAEFLRFARVAEPLPDGSGWFDPTAEPVPVGDPIEAWRAFERDCCNLGKEGRQ